MGVNDTTAEIFVPFLLSFIVACISTLNYASYQTFKPCQDGLCKVYGIHEGTTQNLLKLIFLTSGENY